jgi:hypothetical protein
MFKVSRRPASGSVRTNGLVAFTATEVKGCTAAFVFLQLQGFGN